MEGPSMSVTPVQASGAVPMMAADGVTAINNAVDYRQGFIGSLLTPAPGGPMSWRQGVFPTTTAASTSGPYLDLLVTASTTADQNIHIGNGTCVVVRSGVSGGPYIVRFAASSTILLDPNPATNSRYDVVYVQLVDAALSDTGTQGAQINVVSGTASATPALPSIPTGSIPLASVLRPSFASNGSTNNVLTAQISDMRKSTGTVGSVRPLLPGDSLTDPGAYAGEMSLDLVSSKIAGWRVFDGTTWHGLQTKSYKSAALATPTINSGNTAVLASITIPDPGWPYTLWPAAAIAPQNDNNLGFTNVKIQAGSSVWDVNVVRKFSAYSPTAGIKTYASLALSSDLVVRTGAVTVYMVAQAQSGNTTAWDNSVGFFQVDVRPG